MPSSVRTAWMEITPGFAGYLALPPAGEGPGLLLWPEIFGVNDHIRAIAEQYALDGFVVIAPDVFWRQAPRVELGYAGADLQRAMTLMQAYGAEAMQHDIAAGVAALRARPEVGGAKIGSLGFCMGGRMAYLAAATAGVAAAVAYYGGGIQSLLDRAPAIACPLQFHFAGNDSHIPPEAVERVRAAVAGKDAEVHLYPGAQHGFNCWARSAYDAPNAALAHGRTLVFLARTLQGV